MQETVIKSEFDPAKHVTADDIKLSCMVCEKSSPIDQWWESPINGTLPKGHHQCPHCQTAFKLAKGKLTYIKGKRGPDMPVRLYGIEPIASVL